MNLNENIISCREVVDFALNHDFSFSSTSLGVPIDLTPKILISSDADEAQETHSSEYVGENELSLTDLLDEIYSRTLPLISSNTELELVERELYAELKLRKWIEISVGEEPQHFIGDTLHSDFVVICRARLAFGKSVQGVEELFALYRCGFWPYAWDGEGHTQMEQGRYLVYQRAV